jgi:hypothetical protein
MSDGNGGTCPFAATVAYTRLADGHRTSMAYQSLFGYVAGPHRQLIRRPPFPAPSSTSLHSWIGDLARLAQGDDFILFAQNLGQRAEHWKRIRTSIPSRATFATVRHRTTRAKGCLSLETGPRA